MWIRKELKVQDIFHPVPFIYTRYISYFNSGKSTNCYKEKLHIDTKTCRCERCKKEYKKCWM